jgi:hypothetical protein
MVLTDDDGFGHRRRIPTEAGNDHSGNRLICRRLTMENQQGTWEKVFCPENACMSEEERIDLPTGGTPPANKDTWVEAFCPEEACEITSPSNLP